VYGLNTDIHESLALPLFEAGILLVDHVQPALSPNDLTVCAALFY
jgi:hypothetical protein